MKLAISECLKCTESPKVGAVVSKDGQILAKGYRGESTSIHAERIALEKLERSECQGSTLYTTLEPCVNRQKDQIIESCTNLIIASGISEVVIGMLDNNNGTMYAQGYEKLLKNNIKIRFFNKDLRSKIESTTFKHNLHKVVGNEYRRFPVVGSGIETDVQFGDSDSRIIHISFNTLQFKFGLVDLLGCNRNVREARGAQEFSDITDPDVFKFPSHFVRMKKGMIAIVKPAESTFYVLVQLKEIFKDEIKVQFQVRNLK